MLGVALLAVLAWALYDIAGQIFPVVNVAVEVDRAYNEYELINSFWRLIPYVILIVFFIFLWRDYPNSKTAKYAFWISVAGVAMLVLSYVFQYLADVETESFIKLVQRGDYDEELIEDKVETKSLLNAVYGYLSSAKILLIFALPFAANTLRNNKKLVVAVFIAMAAMLFEEFFQIHTLYTSYYDIIDVENLYIMMMVKAALCYVSFAYLFYAYSQKDDQLVERGRLSAYDWVTIAGVCLTTVFFFCKWMNYEKMYLTLGCYVVPFAAMGLMIMPLAILSILDSNDLGKKLSSIALIAWPFVVGQATWIFEVNDGMTVGDIISEGSNMDNFKSEFFKATHLHYVLLYTLCSIASGIMILMKTFQTKLPADAPRKLTKDEEIAKLKAELEALKSQKKTPDTPVSEE